MSGIKYDTGKDAWHLLPLQSVRLCVRVLMHGAARYPDEENWRRVKNARTRYFDALCRHLFAWKDGEYLDESGLPHLAHAAVNALFLLEHELMVRASVAGAKNQAKARR